jgi:hypothetical protein
LHADFNQWPKVWVITLCQGLAQCSSLLLSHKNKALVAAAEFQADTRVIKPKPTDRDSLRDAPAALCESGPEGNSGASPSNTAPHNSNTALPDGFKLLRLAVDSLYLSFPGELNDASFSALQKLKTNAQSENLEQLASAQYPIGSHIFEVKDRGAGLFPIVLVDNAYRIQLSRPGKKLPMAYVQVKY